VQPLHQQKEEIKDKIEWEQGLDSSRKHWITQTCHLKHIDFLNH
jgi:hypothetical protein